MLWWRQVVRQLPYQSDILDVIVMVGAHDRNRMFDARPAACAHRRKQDHFFLGHVILHLTRKRGQSMGKTLGGVRIISVNLFDTARERDQRCEVGPVHRVIVGQDVIDESAGFLRHCGGGIVMHGTSILR